MEGSVRTQCAFIARVLAGWAGSVELDSTNTTDIIFWHIPAPGSNGVPFFDSDLHGWGGYVTQRFLSMRYVVER